MTEYYLLSELIEFPLEIAVSDNDILKVVFDKPAKGKHEYVIKQISRTTKKGGRPMVLYKKHKEGNSNDSSNR